MSRPRSRSPAYRMDPWEGSGFHPQHAAGELNGDRSVPEEVREYFSEEAHAGGQRRAPPRPHHLDQKEFSPRRPPLRHDDAHYQERRFFPQRDAWRGADRRRGSFRPRPHSLDNRARSPQSPIRMPKEGAPPMARPLSHHQQRAPGDWRREEQGRGRGRGRFRESSPGGRSDQERGRRSSLGPPHLDRNHPPLKWRKQDADGGQQAGFFGAQGFSVEPPRGDFGGSAWGAAPPESAERGRGIGREAPRWARFEDGRDVEVDCGGRPSQERFRDEWRERRLHEPRGSPPPSQDRPRPGRLVNRGGPANYGGRGAFRPMRNRYNHHRGARTGPLSTQPRFQQSPQEYQDGPEEGQRGQRPPREDSVDHKDSWTKEDRGKTWDQDRHPDPKMPRQRQRGWNQLENKNMAAAAKETLTIKVDMSRPAQHNSLLCYSSDRQLSLDLVHVGRQRLDFLPMLEHSGSDREAPTHTGTFAQEIITLVHQVKDQYFRGDQRTLNQRFSASKTSSCREEGEGEGEELTLDQRFSSNRGVSLDMDALLDDEEPLFSSLGPLQGLNQPVRGPGDLRHDLERRRQEKLEGVKVTIQGRSTPQRLPQAAREEQEEQYSSRMKSNYEEDSDWVEEQSMRREERMDPRRGGAPSRPASSSSASSASFWHRNERFTGRRPNFPSSSTGPDW